MGQFINLIDDKMANLKKYHNNNYYHHKSKSYREKFSRKLIFFYFCLLCLYLTQSKCYLCQQTTNFESDEQFASGFEHHDIGRISGQQQQQQQAQPQPQPQQPIVTKLQQSSISTQQTTFVPTTRSRLVSSQHQLSSLPELVATSSSSSSSIKPDHRSSSSLFSPQIVKKQPLSSSFDSSSQLLDSYQSYNHQIQTPVAAPPVYVSQPAFTSFQHQHLQSQSSQPELSASSSSFGSSEVASTNQNSFISYPTSIQSQLQSQSQSPNTGVDNLTPTNDGSATATNDQLVAPSYESVLAHGCPHKGVFSYENGEHCDRYYLCTNGTFSEETCPNGLSYGTQGAVYQHCAYRWNIDCGKKKSPGPISSPGCPWQFGVFPVENGPKCSINYYECEWGIPEVKRCHPEGLFYDDRIKGCQWADQLGCKSEGLLGFKCPQEDEDNPYWPYPRYYHSKSDVIVCVNQQPRLVHCSDEQHVEQSSLACVDNENKKKKKKF